MQLDSNESWPGLLGIEFQLELLGNKNPLIRHIWAASFVPFFALNVYVYLLILAESFQDYSLLIQVRTNKLCNQHLEIQ